MAAETFPSHLPIPSVLHISAYTSAMMAIAPPCEGSVADSTYIYWGFAAQGFFSLVFWLMSRLIEREGEEKRARFSGVLV